MDSCAAISRAEPEESWRGVLRGLVLSLIVLIVVGCASVPADTLTPEVPTVTPSLPQPTLTLPQEPSATPPSTPSPLAAEEERQFPSSRGLVPGQPVTIRSIKMDTPTEGWAVAGVEGNMFVASFDHLLNTSDGGRTWREVTPPWGIFLPELSLGSELDAAFFDGPNAWIKYGNSRHLWRTWNGGETWSRVSVTYPTAVRTWLTFTDGQHGWILQSVEAGMGSELVALFRTTDGGGTWEEILDPYASEYLQSCFKTGMAFSGTTTGWVTFDCQGNHLEPFLAVSADGGLTWEELELPLPEAAPASPQDGYCRSGTPSPFSTDSGVLVVTCVVVGGHELIESSFVYSTDDAGESWQIREFPGGTPRFFDARTVLALGRDQFISIDGGGQWTWLNTVSWVGQYSFVDPNIGWAVATREDEIALVATTSGGRNWEIIEPVISAE